MYNRCKRGNELLATALHDLHMRNFIDDLCEKDSVVAGFEEFASHGPIDISEVNEDVKCIMNQYDDISRGKRKNRPGLDALC